MPTHIEQPELGPFQSGIAENAVESFLFGLLLYRRRTWGNQARHFAGTACEHSCCRTQILDPCVSTGADEHAVDGDVG